MADIKILIAAHKPYWMPTDDIYLPIHVGKYGKEDLGFVGDDSGENISSPTKPKLLRTDRCLFGMEKLRDKLMKAEISAKICVNESEQYN